MKKKLSKSKQRNTTKQPQPVDKTLSPITGNTGGTNTGGTNTGENEKSVLVKIRRKKSRGETT
jgi:hypothetical protein